MFEISATKLDTYTTCPAKYKYKYIDQIEPEAISPALVFGSAVHGTIKHVYRRLMSGQRLSVEEAENAFTQDWEARCCVPVKWNGQTPEQMHDQGATLIKAYLEAVPEPVIPVAVEQEMRAPIVNLATGEELPGVGIMGILDRVEPYDTPIELKTSSQSYSQLRCDLSLQMSIYSYLLAYHAQADEINGVFEVIVKTKTPKIQRFTTCRNVRHFDTLFGIIKDVLHCIDSGIFPYYPNHQTCTWCDYFNTACNVMR